MEEVAQSWHDQNKQKLDAVRKQQEQLTLARQQIDLDIQQLKKSIEDEEQAKQARQQDFVDGLKEGVRANQQKMRELRFRDEEESMKARLEEIREENRLARHLAAMEVNQPEPTSQVNQQRIELLVLLFSSNH